MSFVRSRIRAVLRAFAVALAACVALSTFGLATAAAAPIARTTPAGGWEELWVPSSMGPVKVQVQWASRGGNAALYLLDGMRARNDFNAWSFETNAREQFALDNVTLVMPVGGESSFFSDWYGPSNFNGQQVTYKWETFLTQELPAFLEGYGVSRYNNGVVGLSMGGSAALTLAAYHPDQFKFAGSLSGYLNLNNIAMQTLFRLAMIDAGGYNIDNMWGAPWDPMWTRNDPMSFAPQLAGTSLYLSAATGAPNTHQLLDPAEYFNTAQGVGLEFLAMANTLTYRNRLVQLGIPATVNIAPVGTHNWDYWGGELWNARPQILTALNAW
jgi:diacylglycerol O-acyltransferase/trehalose O-mycolyltransferase